MDHWDYITRGKEKLTSTWMDKWQFMWSPKTRHTEIVWDYQHCLSKRIDSCSFSLHFLVFFTGFPANVICSSLLSLISIFSRPSLLFSFYYSSTLCPLGLFLIFLKSSTSHNLPELFVGPSLLVDQKFLGVGDSLCCFL